MNNEELKDSTFKVTFDVTDVPVFHLNQTCGACPETYDVYVKDKYDHYDYIGYLYVRHGAYSIISSGEKVISQPDIKGDGLFEYGEREHMIKLGCSTLWKNYKGTEKMTDEDYFK